MPNALLIDQGNTRTKLIIMSAQGAVIAVEHLRRVDFEPICELCERHEVNVGIWCSVTHIDARVCESLRQYLGGRLIVLTRETPLPFGIREQIPPTLGADCVASLVGARALYADENLLVVDAGTCITLDVLPVQGAAMGNISPGLKMRLRAMHEFTAALPEVPKDGELPDFGYNTATAMRVGAIRGAAAEIAAAYRMAHDKYDGRRMLLTGGDAELLLPLLPNDESICHEPQLVATGLLNILQHNEYL